MDSIFTRKNKKMLDLVWNQQAVERASLRLESMHAQERVEWTLQNLPSEFALSSSFGIQSAVSLHLITRIKPGIPVILVDTGYLFAETYRFVDELTEKLDLNLKVYRAERSAAWQEARYGRLWEQGLAGLERYNQINKVQPMDTALEQLDIFTWFAGLMRSQSRSRESLPVLQKIRGRLKVHPIIDWDNRTVYRYLKQHQLPYHPLWEQSYVSVGDRHSTVPLSADLNAEQTRFGGLKRECGLHEDALNSDRLSGL